METIPQLEKSQQVEESALQVVTLARTASGLLRPRLLLVRRGMGALSTCMSCHLPHSVHWCIVHNRLGDLSMGDGNLKSNF